MSSQRSTFRSKNPDIWLRTFKNLAIDFGNIINTFQNNNIFVFNNQIRQNAEWYNQYEQMITSYYRSRLLTVSIHAGRSIMSCILLNTAAA